MERSRPMRACGLAALLLAAAPANAEPWFFKYTARVDGSDRAGAPTGSILTGTFSYDPDAVRQVGMVNYFLDRGTAHMNALGSEGFFLSMEMRVAVVYPGADSDTMTMQTFEAESPNDWHMVFDLIEPGGEDGWLKGGSSLPAAFPEMLDNAWLTLYFTDEYDWVRVVDATFLTIERVVGQAQPMIETDGDVATTILELPLGGRLYDVRFRANAADRLYGNPPAFEFDGPGTAAAARDAIIAVLNQSGSITGVGPTAKRGRPAFRIPYGSSVQELAAPPSADTIGVEMLDVVEAVTGDPSAPGTWAATIGDAQFPLGDDSRWARFVEREPRDGDFNQAPDAVPGGPYAGVAGLPVQFDGVRSADVDGTIEDHAWDFGDGNLMGGASPQHTYLASGRYSVVLTVTDDKGASSSAATMVNIGANSLPPTAHAGGPYRGAAGAPLQLDARGSTDPDSDIVIYQWNFGDGKTERRGKRRSHTWSAPGRYPILLTVTDDTGDSGQAVTWVDIGTGNAAPMADAGGPYAGTTGREIEFDGRDSTGTGGIQQYAWDFGDGSPTGSGARPSHIYLISGSYSVTLTVTDADGLTDAETTTVVVD